MCYEYVLLPLVNNEASLAYGRTEYSREGNPGRDKGGKEVESERCHIAAEGERCQNIIGKPQPCDNT